MAPPARDRYRLAVLLLITLFTCACFASEPPVRIERLGPNGEVTAGPVQRVVGQRLAAPAAIHPRLAALLAATELGSAVKLVEEDAPAGLRLRLTAAAGPDPALIVWVVVTSPGRLDLADVSRAELERALAAGRVLAAAADVPLVAALLGGVAPRSVEADDLPRSLASGGEATYGLVPLAAVTPRLRALALDGVDPVRAALTPAYPLVTRGHIEADAATPGRQEVAARLQAALATDAPPPVRLAFTGDIIPTRCVYDAIRRTGDWAAPFRATAARLESADLTIGSLDAAISGRGTPIGCRETFSLLAPPGVVEGLTLAGFDAITVATNHVKDCGVSGCGDLAFLDTLDILRRAGIKPVGGGRTATEAHAPVLLEAGSVRFALLAYDDIAAWLHTTGDAPGTAGLDPEVVAAAVAAARARADVVIVLPQWGEEYTPHPTSRQQLVARRAIEAGATLIVGNHAHVVQAAAPLGDGYVAYALGNFVFDQDWSRETTEGVVLEATFHGPRLAAVDLLPVRIRDRLQPVFLSPEDGRAILARISDAATRLSP